MTTFEYEENAHSARTSQTDGVVSISLNDSWTGRKLLESIGHDFYSHVTPEKFNVGSF